MAGISLVVDCRDPRALASFWAAALRYWDTRAGGHYALLSGAPDGIPDLVLQRIPEPKVARNRMHLDIVDPDIEREAARLERLGARRLEERPASRVRRQLDRHGRQRRQRVLRVRPRMADAGDATLRRAPGRDPHPRPVEPGR